MGLLAYFADNFEDAYLIALWEEGQGWVMCNLKAEMGDSPASPMFLCKDEDWDWSLLDCEIWQGTFVFPAKAAG